jgi:hypothetical protein
LFCTSYKRKGFNGSKNNRTATEQIAYESLVAGSGTILLHPGMDTGDVLTNRALVPMQKNIVQALDTCVSPFSGWSCMCN